MPRTSMEKPMELHKLPTRRALPILDDLGPPIAVARKMLVQREAGASWPQIGIFDPSKLFGKESRMFSMATLLESQGSCTRIAAVPAVPPLFPHSGSSCFKGSPTPTALPSCFPNVLSIGVSWDSAAKQQEYVRLSLGEGGG